MAPVAPGGKATKRLQMMKIAAIASTTLNRSINQHSNCVLKYLNGIMTYLMKRMLLQSK